MSTFEVITKSSPFSYKRLREDFEESKTIMTNLIEHLLERATELEEQLHEEKSHWDRCEKQRAFVAVLIDGDNMPFSDTLVERGKEGGHEAAHLLKRDVESYTRNKAPEILGPFKIIVRVFANTKGLFNAYVQANPILSRHIDGFIEGFNKEDALIDYIDVGNGKECADYKINENFKLYIQDPSCLHIVFGGSADNGYARTLGPYSREKETARRVTLVEGPPFAREVAEMVGDGKFCKTSFETVFRNSKLPSRKPSPGIPASTASTKRYAEVAANGPGSLKGQTSWGKPQTFTRRPSLPNQPTGNEAYPVDPPMTRPAQQHLDEMKDRKACARHHLLGRCKYGNGCKFDHKNLNDKQLEALRYLTRLSKCRNGKSCYDFDCPYSHS